MSPSRNEISSTDLTPFEIIRCETALSRYPIHNLSTKDGIRVEIKRKDENGATQLNWEVSYNSRYGQPGRLAYKIDTIIVNREIDESNKPVPKILKLGSLRDIAARINAGVKNTNTVKRALLQNASAFITAKITFRTTDRAERNLEAAFTRYSVVFTGESLPDGRRADAVYLVLNDIYQEVINSALTRPLDYDYLQGLSPSEQRFYEIISYQIYPALKYEHRARILYSEYCALSTQVRYFDFDHVKKQMYKIHRPHLRSEYLLDVEYEATVDADGNPDWAIFYTPGARARNEQLAFRFPSENTRLLKELARSSLQASQSEEKAAPPLLIEDMTLNFTFEPVLTEETLLPAPEPVQMSPAEALVRHFYATFHRNGEAARPSTREIGQANELLKRLGKELSHYLVDFAFREAQKTKYDIQTFGGLLQYEGRVTVADAEKRKKEAQSRRVAARQRHEEAFQDAYRAFLGVFLTSRFKAALPEAYEAFVTDEERTRRFWKVRAEKADASPQSIAFFQKFDELASRSERLLTFAQEKRLSGVPSFWEWDRSHNPKSFPAEMD